eukprot:scaffold24136_cov18-Tisochrysis_lutea.AAC.2
MLAGTECKPEVAQTYPGHAKNACLLKRNCLNPVASPETSLLAPCTYSHAERCTLHACLHSCTQGQHNAAPPQLPVGVAHGPH